MGVGLVGTNDVHFLRRQDKSAHEVLTCISTGKTLADAGKMVYSPELYLKSPAEMRQSLQAWPGAADNTLRIAEMCDVKLDFSAKHLPAFQPPEGLTTAEHLRNLAEAGLRPVMPDLPEEKPAAGDKPKPIRRRVDKDNPLADLDLDVKRAAEAGPPKPWPKLGFSEDYEFVLVVGLHHEPVPHRSTRRRAGGEVVYFRSSRMTAWAILFRCKTRTAFWGATTVAKVGYQGVADPPNVAAETALGYLDFSKIGEDNIPEETTKLSPSSELRAVDLAAMLVQTQRADAVAAVIKTATSKSAYKTSAPVMRYFSARGAPLDFRTDPASAKRRRQALASQRVMVRLLLIEQLRGVRGVQACLLTAGVPRVDDLEIGRVGQYQCGLLEPLNADDEVVLISELANGDRRRAFARNHVAAVKNLGKCRHYIDEAMAVARTYAERKPPPPRQGGRRRRDYLKEAGQQALAQLRQAKAQQKKAKPAEVEDLDLPDW